MRGEVERIGQTGLRALSLNRGLGVSKSVMKRNKNGHMRKRSCVYSMVSSLPVERRCLALDDSQHYPGIPGYTRASVATRTTPWFHQQNVRINKK